MSKKKPTRLNRDWNLGELCPKTTKLSDDEITLRWRLEQVKRGELDADERPTTARQIRQDLFVEAYAATRDLNKAAALAGLSRSGAAQMLQRPHIAQKIDVLVAEQIRRTRIDADRILADMVEVVDIALARKPTRVTFTETDRDTGQVTLHSQEVYKTDLGQARGALEALGKHLKLWSDNADVNINLPKLILNLSGAPPGGAHEAIEGEVIREDTHSPAGHLEALRGLGDDDE